jgi:hypothetical protein
MKKILSSVLRFVQSYFLQAILSVIALGASDQAYRFGNRTYWNVGTYKKGFYEIETATDIAVSTGFNGGAISMGLIASMCIFGIIWIEISKQKP